MTDDAISTRFATLTRGKPPTRRYATKAPIRVLLYIANRVPRAKSRGFLYNSVMYFVYMIKNSTNKLYIGITQNPSERLFYHNSLRGAKFTKYISDFRIVFLEEYPTLADARKREIQLKKWRREKKEMLIKRYQNGLTTKH